MDLSNELEFAVVFPITSCSGTKTSSNIAIGNAQRVTFEVTVGTASTAFDGSNYWTFTVLQGATTSPAGTAIASQYVAHGSWDRVLNDGEADAAYAFDFIPSPGMPNLKLVCTETGTTDAIFGANCLIHRSHTPTT